MDESHVWPETIDWLMVIAFLAVAFLLPITGWVFLYLDLHRWIRSLRRALVRTVNYLPHIPQWARRETPECFSALGLRMPCTVDDLKRAYRKKVKQLHPDRGGDEQRFRWLQSQFEQALALIESQQQAKVSNGK